ncbi:uncharacterized protein LOC114337279 isoform X2 [Diabrotica virgifera virgifera]|uniref:Uncharacterized protein LOC114337279 isoform X1 n=1 Tax=Diabrotica virgifera virgifera TaxID=50390 RepID=A0A6P7G3C8_DIAVI|nr:uncharacterized protein LOC114337279 isoform X2 [Diabrotica virgifera virgifera]
MSDSKKRKMELSTPEEVITKFHNLDGDLIGERKKCFFTLLKTASQNLTPTEIDYVIDNLNPKSYQQKLFYVYAIVYFKKTERLIQVLKDCNRDHIKIVMQQHWFIEEAFKDMAPNTLVNEFFPEVSYSTRLKLLNRITRYWSEEKNDELFSCLQQRYGFYVALNVLQACSATLLEEILSEHETILTINQVLYLLNRSDRLFSNYMDHWESIFKKPYKEKNVITLLACKYPELFLELHRNEKICCDKLTASASNSLLLVLKEELYSDSHRFGKILNTRKLVKSLGSEFQIFYRHLMPNKFEDLNENSLCIQLLKYVPKKTRWELLTQSLNTVFPQNSIKKFLEIIDETILKLNPGKDVIYQWARIKYENSSDDNFLQYYPSSESIPVIKEMINLCSDMRNRQSLIKHLISTCAHNNDLLCLDKVLEYIVSRHKNEEPHAYMRQIQFLLTAFKTEKFTKEHWNFIQQQLVLMRTKDVLHYSEYIDIEVAFLEYSYKNDRDAFKLEATEFMKRACDNSWNYKRDFENSKLKYELFLELVSLFLKEVPSTSKYYKDVQACLIPELVDLCKKYPEKCINISDYPEFVSAIETILAKNKEFSYSDFQVITSILTYNIEFPQFALTCLTEAKILEVLKNITYLYSIWPFIESLTSKKCLSILETNILYSLIGQFDENEWELRYIFKSLIVHHPKIILKYINKFVYSVQFCKEMKHYSHLKLDQKICDHFINDWSEATDERKETALNILIQLLDEDEFTKFFNEHLKMTLAKNKNADDIVFNKIQNQILRSFKDVLIPQNYIPLLLNLCDGNLQEAALPSFCSLFARSPEKVLYSYIENMFKQNSQMQECSLILSNQFLEQNYVVKLLKLIKPNSYSTLKFICLFALKVFVKTESEDVLTLFINFTNMFEEYDRGIFSSFVKTKVSKKYAFRYIETCWKMIERFMLGKKKSYDFLNKLLTRALDEEIVKSLSSTFVKNIIISYFAEGDKRLSNINSFVLYCLAYREEDNEINYKMIFQMLAKQSKGNICLFCYDFVEFQNNINQQLFVDNFIQHWKQNFVAKDTINEHILLNLLCKSMNESKEDFAKSVVDYLLRSISDVGPFVYVVYARNLDQLLSKTKRYNIYDLLHLMLLYKPSSTIYIFVLNLLKPVDDEETEEVKTTYKSILGILKDSKEPIVKCSYEQYVYNNNNAF